MIFQGKAQSSVWSQGLVLQPWQGEQLHPSSGATLKGFHRKSGGCGEAQREAEEVRLLQQKEKANSPAECVNRSAVCQRGGMTLLHTGDPLLDAVQSWQELEGVQGDRAEVEVKRDLQGQPEGDGFV